MLEKACDTSHASRVPPDYWWFYPITQAPATPGLFAAFHGLSRLNLSEISSRSVAKRWYPSDGMRLGCVFLLSGFIFSLLSFTFRERFSSTPNRPTLTEAFKCSKLAVVGRMAWWGTEQEREAKMLIRTGLQSATKSVLHEASKPRSHFLLWADSIFDPFFSIKAEKNGRNLQLYHPFFLRCGRSISHSCSFIECDRKKVELKKPNSAKLCTKLTASGSSSSSETYYAMCAEATLFTIFKSTTLPLPPLPSPRNLAN